MKTENHYTETDLGNISLNPRGEYDPEAFYEYLDTVSMDGGSYMCLAELGTKITGTPPVPGINTEHWQVLTLPGGLTPEYITMHDEMTEKAKQVEVSRAAVELSQSEIEAMQADVAQLHKDTQDSAQSALASKNQAAGYASAADTSRQAAERAKQDIDAQIPNIDAKLQAALNEIDTTRQSANTAVKKQEELSVQAVKDQTGTYITEQKNLAKQELDEKVNAFGLDVDAIKKQVSDEGAKQVEAVRGAQNTATKAVETAKTEAVKTVQSEGTTQTRNVTQEGTKQVKTITDTGTQQTQAVTAEGQKQLADVQAAAQEIVADRKQIQQNKADATTLKKDIGELPNNIVSSTDSFIQYNYAVKSGEKHRFGLFDYSGDYFKQCEIYLFRQDNSYEQIGILKNVGEFIDYVATDNYAFVRYIFQTTQTESNTVTKKVYSHLSTLNGLSNEIEENRKSIFKNTKAIATGNMNIAKITSTLDGIKAFVGEKREEIFTITSSPTWKKTEITLAQNTKYDISVAKNDNIDNVILYDIGYNQKALIYNKDQGLTGISYTPTENFTAMFLVYLADKSISTDVKLSIKSGLMGKDEISKDEINVLIIGDSYSALGTWVNKLSKMVNINNLVNLGVPSATLKDKYKDTTLYPYTSRPVMSSSDGNLNVFHNQILKLKRLMDGTDLDSGESQIYTTLDEHPDVIFIEGGTNDGVDSTADNYQNVLYDQKICYVKYGENDIRNSNAYIKKEMKDVDKTTFVGALSYLHSELHTMFPEAKIIMISPCGLSYPNGNNMDCITIDNQLTEASKYFAMPVVHWLNTGVSYYNIPTSGDGTENNPYSIADTTDTKDWLHPTSDSASKLAKEVYAELKKYFNV